MMQEKKPALQPPLSKPAPAPGKQHPNGRPPLRLLRDYRKPEPKPVPPPTAPSPRPAPQPEKPPAPPREFFCRQCDRRASGAIPAGWYHLGRHVVKGSLPEPWHRLHTQPLGVYCSLVCVLDALPRLELLEADFGRRGVGLRKLAANEAPPALPAAVTKGGPQ